jgi:hypothetical protein
MKREDRKTKKRVMDFVDRANSEEYETTWNRDGTYQQKKKSDVKRGRKSRSSGARFELKVRKDLEEKGKIVAKWTNNVDLEKKEMTIAKRKYNPFLRAMTVGTGFPDFIAIQNLRDGLYSVIGVESKMNGSLSREEKEKCGWYLKKKTFSRIWIAKKGKKRGSIEYDDFEEKYLKNKSLRKC